MKQSNSKILKYHLKLFLYKNFNYYKGKNIGIHLQGGLCNKLHCLMSACDIALNEDCRLIEPYFGWKQKILFSEIYDLDYFNKTLEDLTGKKEMIISRKDYDHELAKKKSIENVVSLWKYSEDQLQEQRQRGIIPEDHIKLNVLKSLKLKNEFLKIVERIEKPHTAIQIRVESDWLKYTRHFNGKGKERIYVPVDDIIAMYKNFEKVPQLFITTGEDQEKIADKFQESGMDSQYFFNPDWEYEQNAAINFEICCGAEKFIGLSRSSYSNLISLKRAMLSKNDESYIYNFGDKIFKRKDMGLQYQAELSISKRTKIC